MNKKGIKGFYIGIFGLFCLSFIMLTLSLLLRIVLIQPIDSMVNNYLSNISPIYLVSTIVMLIATFVGFINSLSLPPTSRNEVEKVLLPIVFVSFSFLAIPSLVNYLLVGRIFSISFYFFSSPLSIYGLFFICTVSRFRYFFVGNKLFKNGTLYSAYWGTSTFCYNHDGSKYFSLSTA